MIKQGSNMVAANSAFTEDQDDLTKHPSVQKSTFPVVTIGDLHGNSLKLLHFLLKNGVASWPNDETPSPEECYQEFYKAYHAIPVTENSLHTLKRLIEKLRIDPNSPLLRIVGDELGDRGNNDLITLWLFEHLTLNGIEYICPYSNHIHYFLAKHQEFQNNPWSIPLVDAQYHSQTALYTSIDEGLVTQEEVTRLINLHKEHLCIIEHGFYDTGTYQHTHALTSHDIGQFLAQKLNLFYFEATPRFRSWSSARINSVFQQYLKRDNVNSLFDQEIISSLSHRYDVNEEEYPFECAIWNRNHSQLARPKHHPKYGYEQRSTHGHELNDPKADTVHIISLDAVFGRGPQCEQGKNPMFYHHEERVKQHELQAIEREVKRFIYQDIECVLATEDRIPREYLTLLTEKSALYQNALNDATFADLHQTIRRLIIQRYAHQTYCMSSIEHSDIASSSEVPPMIQELRETIHFLQQKRLDATPLEGTLSIWNNNYNKMKTAETSCNNVQRSLHNIQDIISEVYPTFTHLDKMQTRLSALLNDQNSSLLSKAHIVLHSWQQQLQQAIEQDSTEMLRYFDDSFNQRAPELLDIAHKCHHSGTALMQVKAEYESALAYLEAREKANVFNQKLKSLSSQYLQSALLQNLVQLMDADAREINNPQQQYSVRNALLQNKYPQIKTHLLAEIQSIELCFKKTLTSFKIDQIKTRINLLKEFNNLIEPNVIRTLEHKATQAQQKISDNEPLRRALIVRCHSYFTHLQKNRALNQAKIAIIEDLLNALGFKQQPNQISVTHLTDFIHLIEQHRNTIISRQTVCGIQLKQTGTPQQLLRFFEQQTGIKISHGDLFIAEVDDVFKKNSALITSLTVANNPNDNSPAYTEQTVFRVWN